MSSASGSGPSAFRLRREPSLRIPRGINGSGRDPEPPGDEIDRLLDGLDPSRLLLGDRDPVSVLQLHHELVEIERVRVEVLPEPSRLGDLLGGHLQLVREMVSDLLEDVLAREAAHVHLPPSYHDASPADGAASRIAPRVTPESASERAVRSIARSSTARAASLTAFAIPSGPELPCPTTATPRNPSRIAPPVWSGSVWRRNPPSAGLSSSPPAAARGPDRAADRTAVPIADAVPSMVFRTTFPVNPSVTITSA